MANYFGNLRNNQSQHGLIVEMFFKMLPKRARFSNIMYLATPSMRDDEIGASVYNLQINSWHQVCSSIKAFVSNVTEAHLLVGVKSVAVKPPMKVWRRDRMSTSAPIRA